jgi:fungal STAND N-terminal Goodbye domain
MSSSTEEATSLSNFQLIVEAFTDYAKLTRIDLSKSSFAEKLECSNSPHSILEMLRERENTFKEYCDQNRRLISCITLVVEVLHAFSAVLGEVVSLVSNVYLFLNLLLSSVVTLIRSPSPLQKLSLRVLMFSSL